MKKIIFLPLLLIVYTSSAQNKINKARVEMAQIMKESGVKAMYVYVVKDTSDEDRDSSNLRLIKSKQFNRAGFPTETKVYNANGKVNTYKDFYHHDTLIYKRQTYFDDQLHSYTLFKNRPDGQVYSEIHYNHKGKKTIDSKFIYNDKGQYIESITKFKGEGKRKTKYFYNDQGQVVSRKVRNRVYSYDYDSHGRAYRTWLVNKSGDKKPFIKHHFDGLGRCLRHTHYFYKDTKTISFKGTIDVSAGDKLRTDHLFNDGKLLAQAKDFLNDNFHALAIYKYEHY